MLRSILFQVFAIIPLFRSNCFLFLCGAALYCQDSKTPLEGGVLQPAPSEQVELFPREQETAYDKTGAKASACQSLGAMNSSFLLTSIRPANASSSAPSAT